METNAFAARLAAAGAEIEIELDALIGFSPRDGERARPKRLVEAMRYAILGGGGRRARTWGGERDAARSGGVCGEEAELRGLPRLDSAAAARPSPAIGRGALKRR
jgi:hypothetical protein